MPQFSKIPEQARLSTIKNISPQEAKKMADEGKAVLIDIREPDEFIRMRIEGARLAPLSALGYLPLQEKQGRSAIFFCHSGKRTKNSLVLLAERGFSETYVIDGGLLAWKKAGLPVLEEYHPISLQRQIFLAMGIIILLLLGITWVSNTPAVLWALVVMALLMINAGLTGACGMAAFLRTMPWNRSPLTGKVAESIKRAEACDIDANQK